MKDTVLRDIQLIVYDFDGVMTDNKVLVREDGLESVTVNRSDGLAVERIKEMEIPQIIVSKEKNRVVEARARKIGIQAIQGIENKHEIVASYCRENNMTLDKVVYVGNDINDLEVMSAVGYPVCPSDAYEEIKAVSKIILRAAGGNGVVRELLNYLEIAENRELKTEKPLGS